MKQVQKLTEAERGTLKTLTATIKAAGDSLPHFLIFKGELLPNASKFSTETSLKSSKLGNNEQDIFIDYLKHFNNHQQKND